MRALKWTGGILLALVVLGSIYFYGYNRNWYGNLPQAGTIAGKVVPRQVVLTRQRVQTESAQRAGVRRPKQVLFGDFHVHTTFSTDAFLAALPLNGGQGYHPIAEACDFARHCSSLDFWAITDHAEALTPRKWRDTKESVRQCQALCGEDDPDLVSFLGYEWTQVGRTREEHYGHKNVIFPGLDDSDISPRPIAAGGAARGLLATIGPVFPAILPVLMFPDQQPFFDFNASIVEIGSAPDCDPTLPSNELPADCIETAETPAQLVTRLEQQGLNPLIIPHGTAWGFYTPPNSTLDKQLKPSMRPDAYAAVEIFSGHGNSEQYRPWRATQWNERTEQFICPPPIDNYLPSCWQAGTLIGERCRAEGLPNDECERRSATARETYVRMGNSGHLSVVGATGADWLDAGQCKDCFQPPFNLRPGGSAQYSLAISNFDNGLDNPVRFNWGFISSSDTHRARAGTGYKEVARRLNTDAAGSYNEFWRTRINPQEEPTTESRYMTSEEVLSLSPLRILELERQASFFQTGGLAAVHAEDRSREAIWDAFQRREIYATSGPRILLWFDLLNGNDRRETIPMGGNSTQTQNPTFEVRAIGSFKQLPGCPEFTSEGLDAERIGRLCSSECYNPSEERYMITRIEIVRIRPQSYPGEPVDNLIDDPFLVHQCQPNEEGCSFSFSDNRYTGQRRDTTYYARAIQEPTPTMNADATRCTYDDEGNCVQANLCYGDHRTSPSDNCLTDSAQRAWSSPVYLKYGNRSRFSQVSAPAPAMQKP